MTKELKKITNEDELRLAAGGLARPLEFPISPIIIPIKHNFKHGHIRPEEMELMPNEPERTRRDRKSQQEED